MPDILELRVYYEDTDFSGRVYHASYLRFLERGRTEWLRARGLEHRELSNSTRVIFAVRGLEIEYLAPALMDDLLTIVTTCAGARGAVVEFAQKILRGEKLLTEARVRVVTLRGDKPTRPPKQLLEPRDPS
jgi:acyl-CoA thioester hydrolase